MSVKSDSTNSNSNSNSVDYQQSTYNSSCETTTTATTGTISTNQIIKLYKKRYFILVIFILYSMSNAFQWIEYAIIDNIITKYYNTTTFWVNCTSVVYMVSYIIGILPATWILDKKGLRFSVLLGSFGTCLGAWVKCLSLHPSRFWVTMIGQTIVATSQLFVLNIPPLLAAVWFSELEVSRATAYGVFGNQVGIALGFFIPSLLVPNFSSDNVTTHHNMTVTEPTYSANTTVTEPTYSANTTLTASTYSNTTVVVVGIEEVGTGLRNLFFGVAILTSILLIIIALFFNDKPEYPPSSAQANAQLINENTSFYTSIKSLATNRNYILLFFTYGLNTGVFYAVSTVLNQMVTGVFGEDYVKQAGYMGVTITFAGIIGSIVCGYILDWTRLFKQITLTIYVFSLLGMIAFTFALQITSLILLFLVSALLGFFMTGYLPIGFEFAAEICYPLPEGTSAGLLNAAAQIFGILFTFGGSAIIENFNSLTANLCFVGALVLGTIMTFIIKPDLRRQAADKNKTNFDNDAKLLSKV